MEAADCIISASITLTRLTRRGVSECMSLFKSNNMLYLCSSPPVRVSGALIKVALHMHFKRGLTCERTHFIFPSKQGKCLQEVNVGLMTTDDD